MSPIVKLLILMFSSVGLTLWAWHQRVKKAGFDPEERKRKDGKITYHGVEYDLSEADDVRKKAIRTYLSFPKIMVMGGILIIGVAALLQRLQSPMSISAEWLDEFLNDNFPSVNSFGEFLRTTPEVIDLFLSGIVGDDFVNCLLSAAYLLVMCGLVIGFFPLRRDCVSMQVFRIWIAGKQWESGKIRRCRVVYALGVCSFSLFVECCLGLPYVNIVCYRSTMI